MNVDTLLHNKMRSLGATTYRKFLCAELVRHWCELVDESISAQVTPVKVEHGVLFVDVKNSSYKDQLKFLKEEILDSINENFRQEEPFVKDIRIAQAFQLADAPKKKNSTPAQVAPSKVTLEEITLTDEEIKRCKEQSAKISDEELRETVLQTLLSRIKFQKLHLANGWHKCRSCETLCAPEEIFCEACKIKEREAMTQELFRIFYDSPWLRPQEAQKILLEKMPHMKREAPFDVIESARTSLIQKVAGRVRFGDEDSPEVRKLVMLKKRLPPDKLTPAIIRRTLIELQYNLSEQPKFGSFGAQRKNRTQF